MRETPYKAICYAVNNQVIELLHCYTEMYQFPQARVNACHIFCVDRVHDFLCCIPQERPNEVTVTSDFALPPLFSHLSQTCLTTPSRGGWMSLDSRPCGISCSSGGPCSSSLTATVLGASVATSCTRVRRGAAYYSSHES